MAHREAAATAFSAEPSVLVFSRTLGFRHASIERGVSALQQLGQSRGWHVVATEDATRFTPGVLSAFDVVVFLNTTGDVLDASQERAFEEFIRAGGGFVGIHSASDTEYGWSFYGALVGAYFASHPPIQQADIVVERVHPATQGLPARWTRSDEWYSFRESPRSGVNVLLALDESSYAPGGSAMGGDHPIAWYHEPHGGRAFYTGLGHTEESYSEPLFLEHLAGGIEWAASGPRTMPVPATSASATLALVFALLGSVLLRCPNLSRSK